MDSFDKSLSWWRDYDDDLSLSAGLTFRQKFALKRYASGNLSKLDVDTNRTLMCSADGKKLKLRALAMRKVYVKDVLRLSAREFVLMKRYGEGRAKRLPLRVEVALKRGGCDFVQRRKKKINR